MHVLPDNPRVLALGEDRLVNPRRPAKPTKTSSSAIMTFWPGLLNVRRLDVPSFLSVI